MDRGRDPVERAASGEEDLQEVATWEPRTRLDALAEGIHGSIRPLARVLVVLAGAVIFLGLLAGGLFPVVTDPTVRILVGLSVVPALLLAVYIRRADVTTEEPIDLLVATLVMGVLFAPFAGIVNSGVRAQALSLGVAVDSGLLPAAGFYFLIVAPGEEIVKLLSVRLFAFHDARFDAVVDGAVYGAVAGLGFALIENALYITRQLGTSPEVAELVAVTSVRALAGPGHVIYSGIAGYYLGLAKFNPDDAGPIVVKGLLIAAFFHGAYNTLVGYVPGLAVDAGVPAVLAIVGFVVVYDGLAGYILYRKIRRYRDAFRSVDAGSRSGEATDFADLDGRIED